MMRRTMAGLTVAVIVVMTTGIGRNVNAAMIVEPPVNTLTEQQREAGWQLLFDGENPERHWRDYQGETLSSGWQVVEDGWLAVVEESPDIITHEKFDSFELFMEWKVADGNNSGIFYMAQEIEDQPIWKSAPEYQILDNRRTQNPAHAAGSLYNMIGSTEWQITPRPVGEVNTARILKRGNHVEHYLNGRLLFSYVIGADYWQELFRGTRFSPDTFAATHLGHIGLQNYSGQWVAFRNIRIRSLDHSEQSKPDDDQAGCAN